MTEISESRTREIQHWLDDRLAEPDLPYQAMAMLRDAAALIRQLHAAEQSAWHAGLDEGRAQAKHSAAIADEESGVVGEVVGWGDVVDDVPGEQSGMIISVAREALKSAPQMLFRKVRVSLDAAPQTED